MTSEADISKVSPEIGTGFARPEAPLLGLIALVAFALLPAQYAVVGALGSLLGIALAVALVWAFTTFVRGSDGLPLFAITVPVDTALRVALTATLCGVLAAVAATLYAPINLVYPAMGHLVITKAFVIIILGGMGSVPGAIVGGLIIGFAESFGAFYISTDYKDIIAFMLLVFILSLRPQGLFTKGVR